MKPFRYRLVVEWSDEDECFVARVPALPGCAAHGETAEEAAREGISAAEGILLSMRQSGDPLPEEDASVNYSGQLRLRLPTSLHERLARLAAADGVSLNQELVALLAEGFGAKRAETRPEANKTGGAKRRNRRKVA